MAIPKDVKIPSSSQFMRLQDGTNKLRFLSDVVTGYEGWKNNKPFRHKGDVCQIKPEQVDLNQNGLPNINYFWAMVVWNYQDEKVQVLEITQKTIMAPLFELESNVDWGDLKNYDISITKKKEGGKTTYTVLGIPPKPLAKEIQEAYEKSECDLEKLFEGKYPMSDDAPVDSEDTPF